MYSVMWFEIKCEPNILSGPKHVLNLLKLVKKNCLPEVMEVVKPVIQRGARHAHSENLLLSLLGSANEDEEVCH